MKTLKVFLLLFLNSTLFASYIVYGQGENNVWYFGYHGGLDFNSGSPVPITNGQVYSWEGVATVSDASGNLLFYTDGITVWNHNHLPMNNGTGLLGQFSSTQSATIVPIPGSSTQYYIFTCPANEAPGDFHYSVVDMVLNAGNGDVTLKNIFLHNQSSEKCVAVYKIGSPDIWVIGHSIDTTFYSYLVTTSGINPPILSYNQAVPGGLGYVVGYMKASLQGNRIAAANYSTVGTDSFVLFDFDCTTGNISNEMIIPVSGHLYGLEFSPDGTKLYVIPWGASPTPIYQYDITLSTAAAISASQITVGYSSHSSIGDAQIGPDQKIYLAIDRGDSLSVINNPNMPGTACNFVDNAIGLGGDSSGIGLPALIRASFCNTTGVPDLQSSSTLGGLQLSPNPSSGIFQVTLPNHKTNCTIEVRNTLGQKVFKSSIVNHQSKNTLDLSFLSKGIYVLKVTTENESLTGKLIKE